ncbi:MAG: peptidoglycan-binding protein [Rhodobacteraceae bacterium]|nr:peptidoglycan-binding protein [Paracoccaceae bacterium]
MPRTALPLALMLGLAPWLGGCGPTRPDVAALNEPDLAYLTAVAPPGASEGTCWGKQAVPAIIETVTDQVLVQPAEVMADGRVLQPAIYRTETRQAIVRERRETWFETPCPDRMTPEVIASLQRALTARALYRGAISGAMDARTRAAIRRYQQPQGLDSGILSLAAARQLGLIEVIGTPPA